MSINRENYDPKVLDTFEIISSFFVDIAYNDLYLKARDRIREGKYGSITDAYKANVTNYMFGIKKEELYIHVAKKLHEYYQRVTVFSSVVFGEFETKILSNFIPQEYFMDFTERDKDANLCVIITRTVQEFGEYILQPSILKRIIDDRNRQNVLLLQDTIVDILKVQREEYYVQFAKKINQRSGKVSEELVKKLKGQLMEEVRMKCDLKNDKEKLLGMINQLVQKIAYLETEISSLKSAPQPPPTYSAPQSASQPERSRHRGKSSRVKKPQVETMGEEVKKVDEEVREAKKDGMDEEGDNGNNEDEEGDNGNNDEEDFEKQREIRAKQLEDRRKQINFNNKAVKEEGDEADNIEQNDSTTDDNSMGLSSDLLDDPGWGGL